MKLQYLSLQTVTVTVLKLAVFMFTVCTAGSIQCKEIVLSNTAFMSKQIAELISSHSKIRKGKQNCSDVKHCISKGLTNCHCRWHVFESLFFAKRLAIS